MRASAFFMLISLVIENFYAKLLPLPLEPTQTLSTKGLKAVEENYFSSTLLPLSYITTECQSPYD